LAGDFGDGALAFNFDFEIGDGAGEDGIVGSEIAGADESAHDDGLAIVADGDVASGLNDESAVGKNFEDLGGKIEVDVGTEGGLAFAVEAVAGIAVEKILQTVGGTELAEKIGDAGLRSEGARLFVFAVGGGGEIVAKVDCDEVADVAGFVVDGHCGERAGRNPEAAGGNGAGEIHAANAVEIVIEGFCGRRLGLFEPGNGRRAGGDGKDEE